MNEITCTQIYFTKDLRKKKKQTGLSWSQIVELGIETKLKSLTQNGEKDEYLKQT